MTDKEFRKLRRSALIEIIYEYQRREQEMNNEIESLKEQLSSKELKIAEAGSIAEAVVQLNELFETAQKTADDYIAQIKKKYDSEYLSRAPEREELSHEGIEEKESEESTLCQTKSD